MSKRSGLAVSVGVGVGVVLAGACRSAEPLPSPPIIPVVSRDVFPRAAATPAPVTQPVASGLTPTPTDGRDLTADAPPAPDGAIGTPHPLALQAMAHDGSWLVICQARSDTDGKPGIEVHLGMHGMTGGDRLDPYLVLGSGAGLPIDSFASGALDGRWVAVIRNGALALIDAQRRTELVLPGADVRDDGYPFGHARAASLAANGTRLAYLRRDHERDQIVIRDLPSGDERVVPVAGLVWRVDVDDAGRWAQVYVIRADTDHDGKLAWPAMATSMSARGCRGPIMSYSTGGLRGDKPTELWLDLASGTIVEDPTIVRAVGDQLLRVAADDTVRLGSDVIAGAACHAELRYVSASPPRVLATCGARAEPDPQTTAKAPVRVLGAGLDVATTELAERYPARDREPELLHGRFWCSEHCYDLATGRAATLPGRLWTHVDDRAMVATAGGWAVYDLVAGTTTPMIKTVKDPQDAPRTLVRFGDALYSIISGRRVATSGDPIVGHDAAGRVLLGPSGKADGLPPGPLHWSPN